MFVWDSYPADYRAREVQAIVSAVLAGECVSVVGLSGAGKSNLMGFLSHRVGPQQPCRFVLVDCNRLPEPGPEALLSLVRHALGDPAPASGELQALDTAIGRCLSGPPGCLSLLLDRFDSLAGQTGGGAQRVVAGNLRALRDSHKYSLTFVTATRRPLEPHTELAELFYANTLWLGPLSESDACWNVARYAARKGLQWDRSIAQALYEITWGYPSFLRAACEAAAAGASLSAGELRAHPAVARRLAEFWADEPCEEDLRRSGLAGHPLLAGGRPAGSTAQAPAGLFIDHSHLTAKEHLLLEHLQQRPGEVCEKDDLIRAVWPEDKIFERGVRDDSLAQLVRRLREKIEKDPSEPRYIHTVPGRGYRFTP
jgi:two-component system response regulator ResD